MTAPSQPFPSLKYKLVVKSTSTRTVSKATMKTILAASLLLLLCLQGVSPLPLSTPEEALPSAVEDSSVKLSLFPRAAGDLIYKVCSTWFVYPALPGMVLFSILHVHCQSADEVNRLMIVYICGSFAGRDSVFTVSDVEITQNGQQLSATATVYASKILDEVYMFRRQKSFVACGYYEQ